MLRHCSLLLGFLLLASCTAKDASSQPLKHSVAPSELTAGLELRDLGEEGKGAERSRRIAIVLVNPSTLPVQSVRAWVRFPSERVTAEDLRIEDGRFQLFAPGEREIDVFEGLVKFGGALKEPLTDERLTIASFRVRDIPVDRRVEAADQIVLTFDDWRMEGDGHTAVLSISKNGIVNIVRPPSSLAL